MSQAEVYNSVHGVNDQHQLAAFANGFHQSNVRGYADGNDWQLYVTQLEDGWFIGLCRDLLDLEFCKMLILGVTPRDVKVFSYTVVILTSTHRDYNRHAISRFGDICANIILCIN